jgi:hypothetical protein
MSTQSAASADPSATTEAPPPKDTPRGQVTLQTLLSRLELAEKAATEREQRHRNELANLGRKLDEAAGILATATGRLDTLARHFLALQAVVRAALPSQLLRLGAEHLRELAEKVPHTRIRLLAPLKGPNLFLPEGSILPVSDQRIGVYMSVVQAALVVDDADDVAVHVRQLVAAEVEDQLTASKARAEQAAAAEADVLQAEADRLRGLAGGAKE